jgi:hypothetical protein
MPATDEQRPLKRLLWSLASREETAGHWLGGERGHGAMGI